MNLRIFVTLTILIGAASTGSLAQDKPDKLGKDWGTGPVADSSFVIDLGAVTPEDVLLKSSAQGFAVWGRYGFSLRDKGQVVVFDLRKKEYVSSFKIEGNSSHCNNAVFGVEKFNRKSKFPLLYVSECVSPERACNVTDISLNGAKTVQKIIYTGKDIKFAQDWFVDRKGKFLYSYGMHDKCIRISKFRLPRLSDSDEEGRVYLDEDDVLSYFDTDKIRIAQGSFYNDGLIYLPEGTAGWFAQLNVLDAKTGDYLQSVSLEPIGMEPESLDIHGRWMYMQFNNIKDWRHTTVYRFRLKKSFKKNGDLK